MNLGWDTIQPHNRWGLSSHLQVFMALGGPGISPHRTVLLLQPALINDAMYPFSSLLTWLPAPSPSPPLTQFFLECGGLVRTDKKPALCKSYQKLVSEVWHRKR